MVRRRNERGAVVLMTALFTVVIVGVSALAVDLGMQRVVRRDMQALADVVALDLARDLNKGKTEAQVFADPTWALHKDQSVARNSTTLGDAPVVTAALGRVDSTGAFTETTSTEVPTAVKVTATSSIRFAFVTGRGAAARSAVATSNPPTNCPTGDPSCIPTPQAAPEACFTIGSWAANLNSGNSALLNRLIGGALSTTVIGYDGLATSKITLGDLATQLNLGTVEELMTTTIKVGDWLKATETILRRHGDVANADLLASIRQPATQLAANVVNQQISLGAQVDAMGRPVGLFDLTNSGDTGLSATVNALDIVTAAAFIANGTNAIDVSPGVTVPGVGAIVATATVIERPHLVCGQVGKSGSTSQVKLHVTGMVNPSVPGGYSVAIGSDTKFTLDVTLAEATGTLTNIICSDVPTTTSPEGIDVAVHTTGISVSAMANIRLSYGNQTVTGLVSGLLGFLGVDVFHGDAFVSVAANLAAIAGDASPQPTFRHPSQNYEDKMSGSYAGPALTAPATVTIGAQTTEIGSLLGTLTGGSSNEAKVDATIASALQTSLTTNFFSNVVSGVNNTLLQTLSDLAGVKLAGADVWAMPRPVCQGPVLVG